MRKRGKNKGTHSSRGKEKQQGGKYFIKGGKRSTRGGSVLDGQRKGGLARAKEDEQKKKYRSPARKKQKE